MSTGLCKKKGMSGSRSNEDIENNFTDLHPPFNLFQANAEAERCLYCYDAPCMIACPTSIDVPTFIHQIKTDNLIGSAKTILSQNIMGGTCARACPTEILCEQVCVLNTPSGKPVKIGALQRFAVDHLLQANVPHPFDRSLPSGKRIAVVGAGPAGFSCAHRSALFGHKVTIFEAKEKPGGLNEYGLAAYKMVDNFAQKEIEFLLQVGGIEIEYGKRLGEELNLKQLRKRFDAVFVGVGLSNANRIEIPNEDDDRVKDAIKFIEEIRQSVDKTELAVGQNVVVIGAGNTAIDAAIQSKRLGAETVTLVYRRGAESMSATNWEVDLARLNGVQIIFWAKVKSFDKNTSLSSIVLQKTLLKNDRLSTTEELFELPCDMLLIAVGQTFHYPAVTSSEVGDSHSFELQMKNGKIMVTDDYETSVSGIFAGGDCIESGLDLTVQAVEDGKQAAITMNDYLSRSNVNTHRDSYRNGEQSFNSSDWKGEE